MRMQTAIKEELYSALKAVASLYSLAQCAGGPALLSGALHYPEE